MDQVQFNLGRPTVSNPTPGNVAESDMPGRGVFRPSSSSLSNRVDLASLHKSSYSSGPNKGSASSSKGVGGTTSDSYDDECPLLSEIMHGDGTSAADNKKRNRRRRKHKSRTKVEPVPNGSSSGGPRHHPAASAASESSSSQKRRPTTSLYSGWASTKACPASKGGPTSTKQHDAPMKKRDLYFCLHCERVGIGSAAAENAVARVTLVNWENEIVLDTFVQVPVPVTDFYETGITAEDVDARSNPQVQSFAAVRATVESTLRGKILIGHHVEDHLHALGLTHPWTDLRDCAHFEAFAKEEESDAGTSERTTPVVRSLDALREHVLKMPVAAPRDASRPVEYCVTALDLYKLYRKEWEESLITKARERERKLELLQPQSPSAPMMMMMPVPDGYGGTVPSPLYPQVRNHCLQTPMKYPKGRFSGSTTLEEGVVSLHCETVGTASFEALARVTMVNASNETIYDTFVQVPVPVVDFRQTGITSEDVSPHSKSLAPRLAVVRQQVDALLRGCHLLVGYRVDQHLRALGLAYPWMHVRDTAYFKPFMYEETDGVSSEAVVIERSLDDLSFEFLQVPLADRGDRNRPIESCINTLELYKRYRNEWEEQEAFLMHQRQLQQPGQVSTPTAQSPHYGTPNQNPPSPMVASYMTPAMLPSPQGQYVSITPERSNSSWFISLNRKHLIYGQEHERKSVAVAPSVVAAATSAASATLSPQAFQFLQEDAYSSSAYHESNSTYYGESSSYPLSFSDYDGSSHYAPSNSTALDEISGSGPALDVVTVESSSLHDDASSVLSADLGSPANTTSDEHRADSTHVIAATTASVPKTVSSSSSWFRFGPRNKARYASPSLHVSMMALQEVEEPEEMVLQQPATESQSDNDVLQNSNHRSTNLVSDTSSSVLERESSILDPPASRPWFSFRRRSYSPGRKHASDHRRRSCSPENAAESHVEVVPDEVFSSGRAELVTNIGSHAIEVAPLKPERDYATPTDSHVEGVAIAAAVSPGRNGSSWFAFRRSKSPDATQLHGAFVEVEPVGTSEALSELDSKPDGAFLPCTQPTAVMEKDNDDWLQEVVNAQSPKPPLPWFRRSPKESRLAAASDLILTDSKTGRLKDAIADNVKLGGKSTTDTWAEEIGGRCMQAQNMGHSWYLSPSSFQGKSSTSPDVVVVDHESIYSDVLSGRGRLLTESTLPTVDSEEREDDNSQEYGDEFEKGMEQNFAYLEI